MRWSKPPNFLASLFNGTPPTAQPVKNDGLTTAGIDVFDYASDPSSQWARIWVTRDSRLPLRMNVYMPQDDGFLLVEFDYSDPQPASFFDPDAFEGAVGTLDRDATTRPGRVFSLGAAPIDNLRPKTAAQIHTVQPTPRLPKILSAVRIPTGEILLTTTTPANFNAAGADDGFEFHSVSDNRGTHYAAGWYFEGVRRNENSPRTTWLIPATPPAPEADTITLHVISHAADSQDLGTLIAPITPGPAPAASDSPDADTRFLELNDYWKNGSIPERTAFLNAALAAHPHDPVVVRAKIALLFELDQTEVGWALYEREIAPRAIETLLDGFDNGTLLAQYILHLATTNRQPEADELIGKAKSLLHDVAADKRARHQRLAEQLLRAEDWNLLASVLALPELREWTISSEKPKLTRVTVAEDATVIVQLALPQNVPPQIHPDMISSAPADFRLWNNITSADVSADKQPLWTQAGRAYDPATHTLALAFRGSAPTLTLTLQLPLVRDNQFPSGGASIFYRWALPVTLPAASTPNGAAWWATNVPNDPTKAWFSPLALPSAFDANDIAAHEALRAGRNAEAAALFANLLHTLETAGPPPTDSPEAFATRRDEYKVGRIHALAAMGDLTAAQTALVDLLATLPAPPDFHKRAEVERYRTAVAAAADVAEALISDSHAGAASALLDSLEKVRPDFKDVPDTLIRESRVVNGTWWYVSINREVWRPLDRVRFILMDASK